MQTATFTTVENADRDGFELTFIGLNVPLNDVHNHTTRNIATGGRTFAVEITDEQAEEIEEFLADTEDAGEVVVEDDEVRIERY